ncbi:unnamed protein product [Caenorhabditis brenneri]
MSHGVPKWIQSLMFFDPYVSIASAVVKSFHLLVLCQKSMRTSSTNAIMTGIALTIICWMYKSISYLFRNAYIAGVCWIPSSYFSELVSWIATSLQDHFERCDALLGISLGLIRVMALKYPVGSVGGSIQLNNLMLATVIPSTVTTITHMPICFALSSQYRQAFKSVFKFGKRNEVGPEETEGTVNSSPTINENPKDKENN